MSVMSLQMATYQTVRSYGFQILRDSRRFFAFIVDLIDGQSPEADEIKNCCDTPVLEIFADALETDMSGSLSYARQKSADLLQSAYGWSAQSADRVTVALSLGCANAFGIHETIDEESLPTTTNEDCTASSVPTIRRQLRHIVPVCIVISVACLVLGLFLGYYIINSISGSNSIGHVTLNGKTTVSEAELDSSYATYTYNGKTSAISIREVMEENSTVEAFKTDDGSYNLPSAEDAVDFARTAILSSEVDAHGIKASDEDIAAYAEETLGTSDYNAIADTYDIGVGTAKDLITKNCCFNILRKEVVGDDGVDEVWNDYLEDIMSHATIQIGSLITGNGE